MNTFPAGCCTTIRTSYPDTSVHTITLYKGETTALRNVQSMARLLYWLTCFKGVVQVLQRSPWG